MPINSESLKNLPQFRGKSAAEIDRIRGASRSTSPVVGPDSGPADQQVAVDADAILDATAPTAAAHLQAVVAGRVKVPPHVRVQASLEVLRSRGHFKPQAIPPGSEEELGATLAVLQRLLDLRGKARAAVDAIPAPAELSPTEPFP